MEFAPAFLPTPGNAWPLLLPVPSSILEDLLQQGPFIRVRSLKKWYWVLLYYGTSMFRISNVLVQKASRLRRTRVVFPGNSPQKEPTMVQNNFMRSLSASHSCTQYCYCRVLPNQTLSRGDNGKRARQRTRLYDLFQKQLCAYKVPLLHPVYMLHSLVEVSQSPADFIAGIAT